MPSLVRAVATAVAAAAFLSAAFRASSHIPVPPPFGAILSPLFAAIAWANVGAGVACAALLCWFALAPRTPRLLRIPILFSLPALLVPAGSADLYSRVAAYSLAAVLVMIPFLFRHAPAPSKFAASALATLSLLALVREWLPATATVSVATSAAADLCLLAFSAAAGWTEGLPRRALIPASFAGAAGLFTAAVLVAAPAHASMIALWSFGTPLALPLPLYALASALAAYAVARSWRTNPLLASAVLLVVSCGVRPASIGAWFALVLASFLLSPEDKVDRLENPFKFAARQ